MSRIIFDFLTDSMLFSDDNIDNNFSKYTDNEIILELTKYREYVLSNFNDIILESQDDFRNLSVYTEMYNKNKLDFNLLKQGSLYIHKFVLKDPIFEFTHSLEKSEISEHLNHVLGMNPSNDFNRFALVENLKYVKKLTTAVAYGYVKLIPGSIMHEPPKNIPLTHSKTGFADALPFEVMEYFKNRVIVSPLEKNRGGYTIRADKPLTPCRGIAIEFRGHPQHTAVFTLMETKTEIIDEKERLVRFINTLPDTSPTVDQFDAWVYQSINQAALRIFNEVQKEILLSSKLSAMFLTQSELVSELLKVIICYC